MYQISGIRNEVSESMLKSKVKKKRESQSILTTEKQRITPQAVICPASRGEERGETELPMALQVSNLLTTLYGGYTLLHGICCHEHRIFFFMSVDKVHVGTLGTWESEAKVHKYIHVASYMLLIS